MTRLQEATLLLAPLLLAAALFGVVEAMWPRDPGRIVTAAEMSAREGL